ncbi:DUF3592 domain-containing protein [Micromonospora sp. WMMD882]|uniref:DUF3592 domain-containing protein n=1 Tax=Micromonospora sp. WMMD882 TaxID=3015151 RepID=UPI00248B4B17|nr:DUF3592 domain-containing protein [Micromonospora sp. WMMD882]WBB78834.1 DUF3592 domain-containing protein [Micromonospora sp. WMMD882]
MAQPKARSRLRPGYWRRHPMLGVLAATLWIVVSGAFGVAALDDYRKVDGQGRTATGTVVSLSERTSRMTVRFTTSDGRTVDGFVSRPDPAPQVGDQVAIRYDPDDPAGNSYRADDLPSPRGALLWFAVGLVPGLVVLLNLRRNWARFAGAAEAWRRADRRR